MTSLSLPKYMYGTTRLGHDDVAKEQRLAIAREAMDSVSWFHTSRQYDSALEVLGEVFAERPNSVPNLIVKVGGGTVADVRGIIADNVGPMGIEKIQIGQLSPGGAFGDQMQTGGPIFEELAALKQEGLVDNFVLEVFPWTSENPLAGLKAGYLDGLIDAFIFYLNPLQRFVSNPLWDELLERGVPTISMRTVCGAPVHTLRDVPGAAWQPYLQERAVEVAPVFEASGINNWAEFCMRFAHSTPNVLSTVGSTSRSENLAEFLSQSQDIEPLPSETLEQIYSLQRRWSDEVDIHAEPWSM